MPGSGGRYTETVSELYSAAKGVPVFPCQSTPPSGKETGAQLEGGDEFVGTLDCDTNCVVADQPVP
jgi:hypothetical protein